MTGLTFPQLGSLLLGRYRIRTSSATSPHLPCRFKAFDQQRSRFVHLDVLAKHDHRAAGLRAEYAALSRIFGPAIVEPYDYFEDDTLVVFSTEWIDARPLKSLLAAGLHLHTATKVEILHDLSHALASAHYRSVIHRGLSSESVLIRTCVPSDETQRVMLRGFDARRPVYLSDVMDTGRMLARTVYDAPEIATGHGYSMRSDIYALGVLAFEIFTGALPYGSLSPFEAAQQRFSRGLPRLRPSRETPHWIPALVSTCTHPCPKKRVASMRDVQQFIESEGAIRTSR